MGGFSSIVKITSKRTFVVARQQGREHWLRKKALLYSARSGCRILRLGGVTRSSQSRRARWSASFVLLPISDVTRGHGTNSYPPAWKQYLAELLKRTEH